MNNITGKARGIERGKEQITRYITLRVEAELFCLKTRMEKREDVTEIENEESVSKVIYICLRSRIQPHQK